MATITNGQTCLEKRGMDERKVEITRSDYNIEDQYGPTHKDALADGDVQGKGVGGSHTHYLPDCNKPTGTIDYSNFSTSPEDEIGGKYDIEGRNDQGGRERLVNYCLYNYENQYGSTLINTEKNVNDGQYFFGQKI